MVRDLTCQIEAAILEQHPAKCYVRGNLSTVLAAAKRWELDVQVRKETSPSLFGALKALTSPTNTPARDAASTSTSPALPAGVSSPGRV